MRKNTSSTPLEELSLAVGPPTPQRVGTVGTVAEILAPAMDLTIPTPPPMSEHPSEQSAAVTTPTSPLLKVEGLGRVAEFEAAGADRPELEANAARCNLTAFKPGDRIHVGHQRLPLGALHQAVVTGVINASVSFAPPLQGLLKDPVDPSEGEWTLATPLGSASSKDCALEVAEKAHARIEVFERDSEPWRRLVWENQDGTLATVEVSAASISWQPLDDNGLNQFLAELDAQQSRVELSRGLRREQRETIGQTGVIEGLGAGGGRRPRVRGVGER